MNGWMREKRKLTFQFQLVWPEVSPRHWLWRRLNHPRSVEASLIPFEETPTPLELVLIHPLQLHHHSAAVVRTPPPSSNLKDFYSLINTREKAGQLTPNWRFLRVGNQVVVVGR